MLDLQTLLLNKSLLWHHRMLYQNRSSIWIDYRLPILRFLLCLRRTGRTVLIHGVRQQQRDDTNLRHPIPLPFLVLVIARQA